MFISFIREWKPFVSYSVYIIEVVWSGDVRTEQMPEWPLPDVTATRCLCRLYPHTRRNNSLCTLYVTYCFTQNLHTFHIQIDAGMLLLYQSSAPPAHKEHVIITSVFSFFRFLCTHMHYEASKTKISKVYKHLPICI